jgi:hypothetical protein
MPDRLTPSDLARFRADYHQCRATIVPLLDHIDAVTAERDRLAAALRGLLDACRHDRDSLGPRVLGAMDAADAALAAEGGG